MLRRILRKLRYAFLLVRTEGLAKFLHQLRDQVYSNSVYVGLEKDLSEAASAIPCPVGYYLTVASDDDMQGVVSRARDEGGESIYELMGRKLFYDAGFRDCYLARTVDGDDVCFIQWMITPTDCEALPPRSRKSVPRLVNDEVWLENSYTFRQYRGKRVMSSVLVELAEMAGARGFRRMVTYVREDKIASIRGCERAGFRAFESVPERRLLFTTSRRYPERTESLSSEVR
jgi:hypothetical protein